MDDEGSLEMMKMLPKQVTWGTGGDVSSGITREI